MTDTTVFLTDEKLIDADDEPPMMSPPEATFHIYGTGPQVAALWGAMALAQLDFKPIDQLREVEVAMKSGGKYSYAYAPLDVVIDATRPALNKQGIALIQPPHSSAQTDGWELRTILAHKDGARLEVVAFLGPQDSVQDLGKNITYLRRYTYAGLVGAQAERDDDGNAQDGKSAELGPQRQVNRSPRQAPPPVPTKTTPANRAPAGAPPATAPSSERQPVVVPPANENDSVSLETLHDISSALSALGFSERDQNARKRKVASICNKSTVAEMTEADGQKVVAALTAEVAQANQAAAG